MANENPTQIPISKLPEFKSDPDGYMIPGYKADQPTAKANLGKMIDSKTKQALAQTQQQIDSINRDMGKYQQLPDVTLTLVESGKRFTEDGSMIADTQWNIGRLGAVSKGNIYELLMGGSDKMVLGTALFVSHTVEKIGGVDTDVYKPIFSAVTTDLPISNYAVLLAGEDYADVLVSYRADVAGSNVMLVSRWGIFASIATQLANLRGDVDLKSFSDGYYDNMGVGYARNLIGDGEPTTEEFAERVAGGSHEIDDSIAEYATIKGNSVVWNQISKPFGTDWRGTINPTIIGNKITFEIDKSTDIYYRLYINSIVDHVYAFIYDFNDSALCLKLLFVDNGKGVYASATASGNTAFSTCKFTSTQSGIGIRATVIGLYEYSNPRIIDLTQMYGAGNEPTTYEEFLKRKPVVADEYAYNEGTIVNMTAEGVKTTGRNLWDEKWESGGISATTGNNATVDSTIRTCGYIKIPHGAILYKGNGTIAYAYYYDKDRNYISRSSAFRSDQILAIADNAEYMRISWQATTYNNDICINISDPSFNGKYEPYQTSERKWAETMKKCFPEGMVGTNKCDELGSTKAVNWHDSVRLTDLSFAPVQSATDVSGKTVYYTSARLPNNSAFGEQTLVGNVICDIGRQREAKLLAVLNWDDCDYTVDNTKKIWFIFLENKTQEQLRSLFDGKRLYYELAEPIVTTYDELNLTSRVWRGGMESIIVPEGKQSSPIVADINYQINAYKTIKANKQGIEELNAKPAIGLTADEVAKIRALIANTQSLEE